MTAKAMYTTAGVEWALTWLDADGDGDVDDDEGDSKKTDEGVAGEGGISAGTLR